MKTDIIYKEYTKKQMLNILIKKPIIFVETSLNDAYVIRKKDIADFIILEAERTGHHIEMDFYMPGIDEPVATTFGWYLNTINPLLRKEIIHRLTLLQTGKRTPKRIKIFNTQIFDNMSDKEMGIDGEFKNFDKLYGKYNTIQWKYNIQQKGV